MNKPTHHKLPDNYQPFYKFDTETLTVYVYDKIGVIEAKEGVTLSIETGFSTLVDGMSLVKDFNWVYISNRINSYSVNPNDYKYLNEIPSLLGVAIVSEDEERLRNTALEEPFCKKPFATFLELKDAFNWAEFMIAQAKE